MSVKQRYSIMASYMAVLIIAGILWPGESPFFTGYWRILTEPSMLISDYFVVGGIGPSLVNSGILGLTGLLLVHFTKTTLSGPTIAAIFTLAGFALFGKTPLNIFPIVLGVALASRVMKERLRTYIVVALFGTALGPVVSVMTFGLSVPYWISAILGVFLGLILPALASQLLHNHQGFNLYNIGFTCGLMGIFVTALLKSRGLPVETTMLWGNADQKALSIFFTIIFASMVIIGWSARGQMKVMWSLPGTLPTDFVSELGLPATLFNMGLVGLIGMAYIALVGGDYNGPTIGGVLTMVGFGAFGKHVRNIWPIMTGVYLGSLLSVWNPSDPGVVLAALFGTTLAPIAGGFGVTLGIVAGAIHLATVMHTGSFHGGMNLYNNGFAGGLVGTLFASISRWIKQRVN